ncbi:hypothetical protein NLI96_g2955 [Meripilus lineatus]|uniref:DUF6533 domain-containing protein n=1 Tax=Meripilus lineatus TaxID=2056292 RepID=A0AAD5YG44_9APHY|nr:hypothetical protein NLI96_g2955 [Physisporinus lineatus]
MVRFRQPPVVLVVLNFSSKDILGGLTSNHLADPNSLANADQVRQVPAEQEVLHSGIAAVDSNVFANAGAPTPTTEDPGSTVGGSKSDDTPVTEKGDILLPPSNLEWRHMPLSQDQVFFAENLTINDYIAEAALFTYEYFITFDQEVERIWRRKFSGASVIFLVNRYSNCLRVASYILANFGPQGRTRCVSFQNEERGSGSSIALSFPLGDVDPIVILSSAFLTLRMWAIWGRSWWALLVFLTLTAVGPAMELSAAIQLIFAYTASLWRVSMEVPHSTKGFSLSYVPSLSSSTYGSFWSKFEQQPAPSRLQLRP